MFRFPLLPLLCVLAVFCMLPVMTGRAQDKETARSLSSRDAVPEKPAAGLLDEGNVFNQEERVLASAEREDFHHRAGVPLFVVTAHYIFGESVDQYGQRLLAAWLQGKPGVVMLYERGSNQLNFSATPGAIGSNDDLRAIFMAGNRAAAALPEEASAAQRLRAVMQAMAGAAEAFRKTGRVDGAENADSTSPPPAQTKPEKPPLPVPPVDFVRDDADSFPVEEEVALKTRLMQFHSAHDIAVYVLTYSFLPNTSAQFHAEDLAHVWLQDQPGVVLVMNRGTAPGEEPLGIAGSVKNEQVITPGGFFKAAEIARQRAKEIHNEPDGSLGKGVRAAAETLMETFAGKAAAARASDADTAGRWNVFTGVAAALVVGTLLLFLFHRFQERVENAANEQFFFPEVRVGRRLGSPQNGGQVTGISFREPG